MLEQVPRERLAQLPSPLHRAPGLGASLGVPLWLKRDDLLGFGFGGNKVRGLEILVADARRRGADVLVTGAGVQSNHVRATAATAAWAGMEMVAVYWGDAPARLEGNYKLVRLLGGEPRFTGNADRAGVDGVIAEVAAELTAAGRTPYPIPRGGACALGVLAHVLAAAELAEQCRRLGAHPTLVWLAVGSGTTLTGWLLGTRLADAPWRVEGVTVSRPGDEIRAQVARLAAETEPWLGKVEPPEVVVHEGFIGDGYGIPSPGGDAAVALAARTQGVFLDPVYTGKAFDGLFAAARGGRFGPGDEVVFVHTGGEPALFVDRTP